MATKLYLHRTEITTPATLPSGEQSSLTADANLFDNEDGTENRLMDRTISTSAQTSLTNTSTADTSSHNYYIARWVSPMLTQTSVAANTWTVEFAASEANAAANFPVSGTGVAGRVCCYVWKPSNGTKYGNILDGNTAADWEEAGTTQSIVSGTFTGAAVNSLTSGDAVIVFELWAIVTQANGTARVQTVFYDGTTENSTTNEAAFISTPENLTFRFDRAPATETTSLSETLGRTYGANRFLNDLGGYSLTFDGSNDQVDLTNDSTLWSQSLSKFSLSAWLYPTTGWDGSQRVVLAHDSGFGAQSFGMWIDSAVANRITFVVVNAAGTQKLASIDSLTLNTWNHVIATYDNSLGSANIKIFVNNVQGGTTGNLTESINLSTNLRLSASSTDFAGQMKDFRFWKSIALDSTQRTDVYNNSTSAPTPDYWLKTREGTGNPVDFISQSKTATLQNGTTWGTNTPSVWSSENTASTESITRSVGNIRAPAAETVSSSESISRLLSAIRTIQENTTISETVTRLSTLFRSLAAEVISITDSVVRVFTPAGTNYVRAIDTETVSISESISRLLAATRNPTETIASTESISRLLTLTRVITENTTVSETLNRIYNAIRSIGTEVISITDSIARALAKNYTAAMTETVVISDSIVRMCGKVRTLTENVSSTETLTRILTLLRPIATEVTTITDLVVRSIGQTRTITENVSITDSVSRLKGAVRTLTETVVISDTLSRLQTLVRAISETILQSDSIARLLTLFRTITDTTLISESVNRSVGRIRAIVENTSISDSITRRFTGTRVIAEIIDITDSLTKVLTRISIPTRLHNLKNYIIDNYQETDPSL